MDTFESRTPPQHRHIIGVIGTHDPDPATVSLAEDLGRHIALKGHVLLTGGGTGVMEGASKGAYRSGGLVIGILPNDRGRILPGYPNDYVTIPIYTGLGDARNVINARTPDVIVALKGSYGTLSEIALALKAGTPVIGLDAWSEILPGRIILTRTVPETMTAIALVLNNHQITAM